MFSSKSFMQGHFHPKDSTALSMPSPGLLKAILVSKRLQLLLFSVFFHVRLLYCEMNVTAAVFSLLLQEQPADCNAKRSSGQYPRGRSLLCAPQLRLPNHLVLPALSLSIGYHLNRRICSGWEEVSPGASASFDQVQTCLNETSFPCLGYRSCRQRCAVEAGACRAGPRERF